MPHLLLCLVLFISTNLLANDLESWLEREERVALQGLMSNISPYGALPGAVIASPSTFEPNYFYHWVRDAALVMDVAVDLYERDTHHNLKQEMFIRLSDFVEFSKISVTHEALGGLGEPKYYVDSRPFDGPWGRPQNDGPALRAKVLTRWAHLLLDEGHDNYVQENLYAPELPANSLIKSDLEFTARVYSQTCFDLWEEVEAQNFYTLMAQKTALLEGAHLANRLQDFGAAYFYEEKAEEIDDLLEEHMSGERGYILENIKHVDWNRGKDSGLDTATLLSVLHNQGEFSPIELSDEWLLSTVENLRQQFSQIYPLNRNELGTAIGRYPEDEYYGGNPWFLTTLAFSQFYSELARHVEEDPSAYRVTPLNQSFYQYILGSENLNNNHQEVVSALRLRSDLFLQRVQKHADATGSMSEQYDRESGYMLSARDLTWSYAAFLKALWSRND